jgi:2-keto-myo-inositol isomerase
MEMELSRREMLMSVSFSVGAGVAAGMAVGAASAAAETVASVELSPEPEPFRYCFNTSTIRGQKLPLVEVIEIAAKAGYQGIEPWIDEIERAVQSGVTLAELKKRIADHGLRVESAIGFAEWIVDDDVRRARGLERMKRDMELVAQIGGMRIAAPPFGATEQTDLDLLKAAQRYRALLELGDQTGVVPMAEVWGFSKTLHRLGQAALVAIESGHPQACILADVYHLYKGGTEASALRLIPGSAMHAFHVNDYPASPPREQIGDADRVYPGDGVAPLDTIFRTLREIGFRGALSLELFNPEYYKQDPLTVAKTGLEKTRAAVRRALG